MITIRWFRILSLFLSVLAPMLFSVPASGQDGWVKLASDTSRFYYDVSFATEQTGVIMGTLRDRSSLAIRTTDGGKTWQKILLPPDVDSTWTLRRVHFFDEQRGYIVGGKLEKSEPYEPRRSLVLSTTDGGASWQRVALDSTLANVVYSDVSFPTSQVGYLAGSSSTTAILAKTTDGGATWKRITGPGSPYYLFEVEFRDPDHGMVTAGEFEPVQTSIWITSDGGVSWKQPQSKFWENMQSVRNITHVTNQTWLLTAGSNIARTTNDAASWDSVYTWSQINSIAFASGTQVGYAVGRDTSTVLKTKDGGATWSIQQSNQGQPLYGVSAPSERVAYAVGASYEYGSTIIKTSGETSINVLSEHYSGVPPLDIMPNPSDGDIKITFTPSFEIRYLKIIDLHGTIIHQVVVHPNISSISLNADNFSAGPYFCRLGEYAGMLMIVH